MSAIWTGAHGWTIERGDYGWVVYQQAKTKAGGDCTRKQSYHATIEQACERVARHVADDEARTRRQYAASIRATMAEFGR